MQHERALAEVVQHQRHGAALAVVVGPHDEHDVFEGDHQDHGPEHERQHAEHGGLRRGAPGCLEGFAERVDRAGADVPEHHAERAQHQDVAGRRMGGRGGNGGGRGRGADPSVAGRQPAANVAGFPATLSRTCSGERRGDHLTTALARAGHHCATSKRWRTGAGQPGRAKPAKLLTAAAPEPDGDGARKWARVSIARTARWLPKPVPCRRLFTPPRSSLRAVSAALVAPGLPRRCAPRNDGGTMEAKGRWYQAAFWLKAAGTRCCMVPVRDGAPLAGKTGVARRSTTFPATGRASSWTWRR